MDNLTQFIYQKLISRKEIMVSDILQEIDKNFLPNMNNIQSSFYFNVIKIINLLFKKINQKSPNSIVISKKNHKSIYLYIGVDDNPLKSEIPFQTIRSTKYYHQFIQKSHCFMPKAWTNYFFQNISSDFDFISSNINNCCKNLNLLPSFFNFIQNQNVLTFSFKPDFDRIQNIIFHPHYLKEYNSRWYVLGQIENSSIYPNIIALDTINSPIQILKNKNYISSNNCQILLKNMIGLHQVSGQFKQEIFIQTQNNFIHNYLICNPLHISQKEILSFDSSQGYGIISIDIVPTHEFYSTIIQFFNQIKITSPTSVVEYLKELIIKTLENYNSSEVLSSENFFSKK